MGTYYSLACYDCKVFIDRGKVYPYTRAAMALFATYQPEFHTDKDSDDLRAEVVIVDGLYAYPVTSNDLWDEYPSRYPDDPQYPGKPTYIVLQFAEDHQGHQLYVYSDRGHMPWDFFVKDNTNWMAWKDLTEPFWDDEPDSFLPRNLVEVMGLKDWEHALTFIDRLSFKPDKKTIEEEIKPEFFRLLEKAQK